MPTNFPLLTDLPATDQAELKRIQAIPAGQRTAGETAWLSARAIYLDSVNNRIIEYDSDGNILRCSGGTVPTDGLSGFAKGAVFIKRNDAGGTDSSYENLGTSSSCQFSNSGVVGGGSFADNETPSGTIDGVNATFTLAHSPSPTSSLQLQLGGIFLTQGIDYTLSGSTITFLAAPDASLSGQPFKAFYRY